MNELKIFENADFGRVRTVAIENEPYFVGKDVAEILGYSNPNEAIAEHIDDEDKLNSKTLSSFGLDLGQRGGWLITESGLYSLVLSSKLPSAKPFKRWITSTVIPSIRKYGVYAVDELLNDPDTMIKMLNELKKERAEKQRLAEENEEMKPKALFADAVATSHTDILIGDLAKILKGNGIEIGQKRLFAYMRENGFLIKCGSSMNMPTQRAMDMGLFRVKESTINNPDGSVRITKTTKVTGRGQTYFVNRFLGDCYD